jgi:hypothetical protein
VRQNSFATIVTRVVAGFVGLLAVSGGVWQCLRGLPVQNPHPPLHTDVLFAPIGILVGSVLVLLAFAPRRWWW